MTGNVYLKANSTSRSSFVCKGWVSGCVFTSFSLAAPGLSSTQLVDSPDGNPSPTGSFCQSECWPLWIFAWAHAQFHSAHLPAHLLPSLLRLIFLFPHSQQGCSPSHLQPLWGRSPPVYEVSHIKFDHLVHPHPSFPVSANHSVFPFQKTYTCVTCLPSSRE